MFFSHEIFKYLFSYSKKERLLSEIEAGGILCTEYKIFKNKLIETPYPDILDAQNVRAAHKYNIAFSHVRENFAVSGLLSEIQVNKQLTVSHTYSFINLKKTFLTCFQEVLHFDGVYFQTLMLKFEANKPEKSERFIDSVKKYVLDSDDIQFDLF